MAIDFNPTSPIELPASPITSVQETSASSSDPDAAGGATVHETSAYHPTLAHMDTIQSCYAAVSQTTISETMTSREADEDDDEAEEHLAQVLPPRTPPPGLSPDLTPENSFLFTGDAVRIDGVHMPSMSVSEKSTSSSLCVLYPARSTASDWCDDREPTGEDKGKQPEQKTGNLGQEQPSKRVCRRYCSTLCDSPQPQQLSSSQQARLSSYSFAHRRQPSAVCATLRRENCTLQSPRSDTSPPCSPATRKPASVELGATRSNHGLPAPPIEEAHAEVEDAYTLAPYASLQFARLSREITETREMMGDLRHEIQSVHLCMEELKRVVLAASSSSSSLRVQNSPRSFCYDHDSTSPCYYCRRMPSPGMAGAASRVLSPNIVSVSPDHTPMMASAPGRCVPRHYVSPNSSSTPSPSRVPLPVPSPPSTWSRSPPPALPLPACDNQAIWDDIHERLSQAELERSSMAAREITEDIRGQWRRTNDDSTVIVSRGRGHTAAASGIASIGRSTAVEASAVGSLPSQLFRTARRARSPAFPPLNRESPSLSSSTSSLASLPKVDTSSRGLFGRSRSPHGAIGGPVGGPVGGTESSSLGTGLGIARVMPDGPVASDGRSS